jgi:hypothetical protein
LKKEIFHGHASLILVRMHIIELGNYCQGSIKVTNRIKSLIECIRKDSIPSEWKEIFDMQGIGLVTWFSMFVSQMKSLNRYFPILEKLVSDAGTSWKRQVAAHPASAMSLNSLRFPIHSLCFSLSDLFFPESFLIASRQMTAQILNCSIDELEPFLEPIPPNEINNGGGGSNNGMLSFLLENVLIEGATVVPGNGRAFQLSSKVHNTIGLARLVWKLRGTLPQSSASLKLPMYVDSTRSKKVFDAIIPIVAGGELPSSLLSSSSSSSSMMTSFGSGLDLDAVALVWAQRGVGISLRSPAV